VFVILPILVMLLVPQDAAAAPVADDVCPSLPIGTVVKVAVVDMIQSRTARNDDMFPIRLAEPLVVDGKTVIAAGTPGMGQVVQAQHPRFFKNEGGELIIAARYLDLGGKHLPLSGFHVVATDAYRDPTMMSYSTNVAIAAGTTGTAKVAGLCVPTATAK